MGVLKQCSPCGRDDLYSRGLPHCLSLFRSLFTVILSFYKTATSVGWKGEREKGVSESRRAPLLDREGSVS